MKIAVDNSIPFVEGVFEPWAEVLYREAGLFSAEDIRDADALIIRTRTRCDESTLAGSAVKIISTATIGTDNIDMEYCRNHGIFVQNASGAVAGGVMDYVLSALYGMASRRGLSLQGLTFGVAGAGASGTRVEQAARRLGFKVLLYDPPRADSEGPGQFCTLDELLENSDIVSLHLPLNESTRGIADESFFSKMKVGAFFINTSHGDLVVEDALIAAIPKLGPVAIDTWNHEPEVNVRLMNMVDIATPHIAGYSYQGKLNASAAAVRAVARFFGISDLYDYFPKSDIPELEAARLDVSGKTQGEVAAIFQYNYPIFTDDFIFRMDPSVFERIRTEYRYRREFFII